MRERSAAAGDVQAPPGAPPSGPAAAAAAPRRRSRGPRLGPVRMLRRALVLVLLLVVWEVGVRAGVFGERMELLLPPPSTVVSTGWDLLRDGTLGTAAGQSLLRVVTGVLVAVLIAIPIGGMIGWSRLGEDVFDPLMEMLRPIPPIAWIPLAILWFGLTPSAAVFIIVVGGFFPTLVSTAAGVRGVERGMIEAAQTLGARGQLAILRKVVVPAATPSIITGVRVSFGIGWMSVVAAEMLAVDSGLGYMILDARQIFRPDIVIVGMVAIGLIGFAMDRGLRHLEARTLRWRRTGRGTSGE
jgi:ABC-type nitrate/sulfonate/bicarbonate transport system permease component